MNSIKPKHYHFSISILVVAIILLSNTLLMFCNSNFYYKQYERLGVYEIVPEEEAKSATESMLDYLTFKTSELNGFFSEREVLHLKDVKQLLLIGFIVLLLLMGAMGLCIYILYRKLTRKKVGDILVKQGYIMAGILVALFLLRKAFGFFFVLFHKIFFSNDLWLLDPAVDKLILLLPQQFFVIATATIIVRSFLISCFLLLSGMFLKKGRIRF